MVTLIRAVCFCGAPCNAGERMRQPNLELIHSISKLMVSQPQGLARIKDSGQVKGVFKALSFDFQIDDDLTLQAHLACKCSASTKLPQSNSRQQVHRVTVATHCLLSAGTVSTRLPLASLLIGYQAADMAEERCAEHWHNTQYMMILVQSATLQQQTLLMNEKQDGLPDSMEPQRAGPVDNIPMLSLVKGHMLSAAPVLEAFVAERSNH